MHHLGRDRGERPQHVRALDEIGARQPRSNLQVVQAICDLVDAGYIDRERDGRRNSYVVKTHLPLGLPQRDIDLGSLLRILADEEDAQGTAAA